MKYIALLRGINVGGNHKVEMKKLRALFEALRFGNVLTYINTGNVIFESDEDSELILEKVKNALKTEFDFEIPILIKTAQEIREIAAAIPPEWKNDISHKTDVAYLFPEIDSLKIIDELPIKKEFIEVRYIKGAIYWNVRRENVYKSNLAKIISHRFYKLMTVRNINTARYLAR